MLFSYERQEDKYELVADYLEEIEDSSEAYRNEWNSIAQGIHSLVKHYDSMNHENVSEVFNEFYDNRNIPPSLIIAEETAINHIVKGKDLDEAKDAASENIDLPIFLKS